MSRSATPVRKETAYLSLSARILLNAEALNMAETIGNVSRHRKAPVVLVKGDTTSILYVPAISGESIAHHYQRILANIANSRGLPVTTMDLKGYFLKYADSDIIDRYYSEISKKYGDIAREIKDLTKKLEGRKEEKSKEEQEKTKKGGKKSNEEIKLREQLEAKICEAEKILVYNSVVADIGGFLNTDLLLKRTSRVRFGYMLPTVDSLLQGAVATYPQLHTRYSPRPEREEQALYYVETSSALYALSATLNASDIGELEYCKESSESKPICEETPSDDNLANKLMCEKEERVKVAVDAIIALLDGAAFGAKRSRFNPVWEVESIVVSVSKGPVEFNVSPATMREYIKETELRANSLKNVFGNELEIHVFCYSRNGECKDSKESTEQSATNKDSNKVKVIPALSHTDALIKAKTKLLNMLFPKSG
jgi:CRISPR-associated protein Csa2